MPGHAPSHLDLVDVGGVRRVGELQRGPPGLEDRHAAVLRGERGPLGQPEHVAVEVQGLVVVGRGDDEAELGDRGHRRMVAPAASALGRPCERARLGIVASEEPAA